MTLNQKKILRELLNQSIESGFHIGYPLRPIGVKLGILEVLYDNNTNTGLLWGFGPHGDAMIGARGNWPNAYASISYTYAYQIELLTHPKSPPLG